MQKLIETWQISHRMNELLLSGIKEEYFTGRLASKGRTVGGQFGHIHNVRLMWLKVAMPELFTVQTKLESEILHTKEVLLHELKKSSDAIAELLKAGFSSGKIKGFKPHPEAFMGYMISHESHHRSQVIMILKENGHLPDKKILYGLWEWGTK